MSGRKAGPKLERDGRRLQYAALPYRRAEAGLEIMLITSRDTGRWVVPKGWPMKHRTPAGAAAREAVQEAGIKGEIAHEPFGAYSYLKRGPAGKAWPCVVDVFPLEVVSLRDNWREQRQRTRRWFDVEGAVEAVDEPELKELITAFGRVAAEPAP